MAAGDYGYGIPDVLPMLLAGATGVNTKDRSASLTLLLKAIQMMQDITGLSSDPAYKVLTGTYVPPPVEEFQPIMTATKGWMQRPENDPIRQNMEAVFRGTLSPADAVANIQQADPEGSAILAEYGGAAEGEVGKWWYNEASKVLDERIANEQAKIKFDKEQRDNDYFAKMGLPSVYETYGLEADPSNGVQQLPFDEAVWGRLQADLQRFPAQQGPSASGMGRGARTPAAPSSSYRGPNATNRAFIEGLMQAHRQTQLNYANAQGRTPLKDNLLATVQPALRMLLEQQVTPG